MGRALGLGYVLRDRVKEEDPAKGDWEGVVHKVAGDHTIVEAEAEMVTNLNPAPALELLTLHSHRWHMLWQEPNTQPHRVNQSVALRP